MSRARARGVFDPVNTPPPLHPSEYSPEVLDVVRSLLEQDAPARVHDPYAGRGVRLGTLCDALGIAFTGSDIERYEETDARVIVGDAADVSTYPREPFAVVTSPVYFGNRISSDYVGGPLPTTKRNGRRAYGISLGRALHPENLARVCRPGSEARYYEGHAHAVKHWGALAIVNVDAPIAPGWIALLGAHGYADLVVHDVVTRRYRGPANSEKRADHEVVIRALATRELPKKI